MFIEGMLPKAREKLVTIADDVPLIEAAKLLQAGSELVIVCDLAGLLVGVITNTDIVAEISHCQGASCITAAALVMKRDVVLCEAKDLLHDVWTRMKARGLKNVPVVDHEIRPSAPRARHSASSSQRVGNEDSMLRDYVMGVGYR